MVRNVWPICIVLFYVFFCNIIKAKHFVLFYHIITLNFFFLHTRSLLVRCAYVFTESIDCILLSSFKLKAILLISSLKTLCLSLLNLCCVFNISLLFYTNSFLSSLRLSTSILFISKWLILFSI